MRLGRAFHGLMAITAFLLPAGLVSGQRPDMPGSGTIEQPNAKAVLFRHYF